MRNGDPERISITEFPAGERQAISHIGARLAALNSYIEDFDAAVSLFHMAIGWISILQTPDLRRYAAQLPEKRPDKLIRWATIAGRDGAMTIYHFGKTISSIREFGFVDCPVFKKEIDHAALRAAQKLFNTSFPNYLNLRHSISHSAELVKDIKTRDQNAAGIWTFQNFLQKQTFHNTFNGKVFSFEISVQTLSRLRQVKSAFEVPFQKYDLAHHRLP